MVLGYMNTWPHTGPANWRSRQAGPSWPPGQARWLANSRKSRMKQQPTYSLPLRPSLLM